jgi:hypothetical protein
VRVNELTIGGQVTDILARRGAPLTPQQETLIEEALATLAQRDLSEMQRSIAAWQRATFGEGDPALAVQGAQKKLEKESHELMLELVGTGYRASDRVGGEIADCLILLLGIADRLSLDSYELVAAKMAVNRARRWPALAHQTPGQPVQHLEEGAGA